MKASLYICIGKTMYAATPIDADREVAVKAWRLRGVMNTYDVALMVEGYFTCTCADGTYRGNVKEFCKHAAGLMAVGLLPKR